MNDPYYATQVEPDGSGHDDCGAACIASVLLSYGETKDPYELEQLIGWRYGIRNRGATSQQLQEIASEYGFQSRLWYLWSDCVNELLQNEGRDKQFPVAVLALNENKFLVPTNYPPGAGWRQLHWVRLVRDLDDDSLVFVYDPLCYVLQPDGTIYQGPTVHTVESVRRAISATPVDEAGIMLWKE